MILKPTELFIKYKNKTHRYFIFNNHQIFFSKQYHTTPRPTEIGAKTKNS